jgi:predicted HTH transcriptional regulator
MTLYEKIKLIYSQLTINDFTADGGTILLGVDENGKEIIESWNHKTLTEPTKQQLDAIV